MTLVSAMAWLSDEFSLDARSLVRAASFSSAVRLVSAMGWLGDEFSLDVVRAYTLLTSLVRAMRLIAIWLSLVSAMSWLTAMRLV